MHYDLSSATTMTPVKGAIFTSVGGTLGFLKVLITTGQMGDAVLLGFLSAAGALLFSLLVALLKKTKPFYKKVIDYIKNIW